MPKSPRNQPKKKKDPAAVALGRRGGLKGGQAIGSSNARGEEPADRPLRPEDIAFTMFEGLGIDPGRIYHTPTGRPIRIAQNGQAIKELI